MKTGYVLATLVQDTQEPKS